MKQGIHPAYHKITVVAPDGSSFETRSCYGKEGATLQLDVDITTHPAWNAGKVILKRTGQMDKFANKFGSMNFSAKKTATE
ncbi:MAG: 50S ribosomal protein L31 [Alphaproteobacteria bacterium]|nr:MAG: 50S ribosomal protein L31 [Alphaproteobacteria bacterium]TAF76940.1 MAG: 50S ribosomal protein L31 [Alphaproteobacteria bacterium]